MSSTDSIFDIILFESIDRVDNYLQRALLGFLSSDMLLKHGYYALLKASRLVLEQVLILNVSVSESFKLSFRNFHLLLLGLGTTCAKLASLFHILIGSVKHLTETALCFWNIRKIPRRWRRCLIGGDAQLFLDLIIRLLTDFIEQPWRPLERRIVAVERKPRPDIRSWCSREQLL